MRAVLTRFVALLLAVGLFGACASNKATPTFIPEITSPQTSTPIPATETAAPEISPTEVEGPAPSYKVGAFYYPWYGNPATDGKWIYWIQNNHVPPDDISSDYYPALGAYSSNDAAVVAQHMEWLRQAGIGVIITSWWGQGSREDQVVPLLLSTAEQYSIKVAFHIEPYNGRTPEAWSATSNIFMNNTVAAPRFSVRLRPAAIARPINTRECFLSGALGDKELTFPSGKQLWMRSMPYRKAPWSLPTRSMQAGSKAVILMGCITTPPCILKKQTASIGHAACQMTRLYVPSVIPGFSAKRIGYADTTYVPREDGNTFDTQWTAALDTGIEPAMVTITSFNEWHEGSIIEPPQFGGNDGNGYTYADFGTLPADGYLTRTRDWAEKYLALTWSTKYRAGSKCRPHLIGQRSIS